MSDTLTGKTVLVAGATGFIGRHLVNGLYSQNTKVLALARNAANVAGLAVNDQVVGIVRDLTQAGSLADVLRDVDVVYHLASEGEGSKVTRVLSSSTRKHVNAEDSRDSVSIRGTRKLLDAAVTMGVKEFIFFSSVKAMGEADSTCQDENANASPVSVYGQVKLEAEGLVLDAGKRHPELHVCILRLPLVYGLDNNGNIPQMIAAVDRRLCPPLPEIWNKRSMVHVSDVVQAALLATGNPAANGQVYIVTDGQVYSSRELYVKICQALGRRIPSWCLSVSLWRGLAKVGDLIGWMQGQPFVFDSKALQKLFGSAWYSSDKITRELGYRPTRTLDDGIKEMVAAYRAAMNRDS